MTHKGYHYRAVRVLTTVHEQMRLQRLLSESSRCGVKTLNSGGIATAVQCQVPDLQRFDVVGTGAFLALTNFKFHCLAILERGITTAAFDF